MSINDEKIELRVKIRQLLEELPQDYIDLSDERIAENVINSEAFKSAKRIFAYYSVDREVGTEKIILEALRQGKEVALPVSLAKSRMVFREVKNLDLLKVGRYGIPEPDRNAPLVDITQIDLAVIPCVSCSHDGKRLGHGGGYYDRFLERYSGKAVMLCYEELTEENIPLEEHDRTVLPVITQRGVFR